MNKQIIIITCTIIVIVLIVLIFAYPDKKNKTPKKLTTVTPAARKSYKSEITLEGVKSKASFPDENPVKQNKIRSKEISGQNITNSTAKKQYQEVIQPLLKNNNPSPDVGIEDTEDKGACEIKLDESDMPVTKITGK